MFFLSVPGGVSLDVFVFLNFLLVQISSSIPTLQGSPCHYTAMVLDLDDLQHWI